MMLVLTTCPSICHVYGVADALVSWSTSGIKLPFMDENVLYNNMTCNVPVSVWMRALVPFSGCPMNGTLPHVQVISKTASCVGKMFFHSLQNLATYEHFLQCLSQSSTHSVRKSIIEYAGVTASLLLATLTTLQFYAEGGDQVMLACMIATWNVAAGDFSLVQ
jgi:hypothetical protein